MKRTILLTSLLTFAMYISAQDIVNMFIGVCAKDSTEGIHSFQFNQEKGIAKEISFISTEQPTFLTIAPDKQHIYAVNEYNNRNGEISAFNVDMTSGKLELIDHISSAGNGPCNIITDGKTVYVTNYGTGNLCTFPIKKNFSIGKASKVFQYHNGTYVVKPNQEDSHLHCPVMSPDGKYMYVTDLGGDCIYKFNMQPKMKVGDPDRFNVAPGSGPRHLLFSVDGKHAYLMTELSDDVIVFNYNAENGDLVQRQTLHASDAEAHGGADIHMSADGKFVYSSVRLKSDGIAIFSVGDEGKLKKIGYQLTGRHPRNFAISPNGKYLLVACRDSNAVKVYKRNAKTGLLVDTHKDITCGNPMFVNFSF